MNLLHENHRHCDDFINDKSQPKCLRKFLLYHRIPAYWQLMRWKDSWGTPELFADWKNKRVRVTMASRFGDLGIRILNTKEKSGYERRGISVQELSNFGESK